MRGNGRIFKRGTTWWIAFYAPQVSEGRVRQIEVRESARTDKESVARQYLHARVAETRSPGYVGPVNERLTVSDVLDAYLALREPAVKNVQSLTYTTTLLRQAFGPIRASLLPPERIDAWRTQMVQQGYAQGSVDRILRILRAAYHLAQQDRKVSFVPRISMFNPEDARQGFCEPGEFGAIVARMDAGPVRDMAEFAYYSGRRPGELEAMEWGQVSLERRTCVIPRSKNHRPWTVALEGPLFDIMQRRLAARVQGLQVSAFVFHENGLPIGSSRRNRVWGRAAAAAGYPDRLWYDLRRTAARDMIQAGVDRDTAMQQLGQTTDAMFSRYNIRVEEDQREAVRRLVRFRSAAHGQLHGQVLPIARQAAVQ